MRNKVLFLLMVSILFISSMPPDSPAFQKQKDPVVITLTAVPGLQFDQVRFSVRPGTQIKIILKNNDDMSHNLVITQQGARLGVVEAALKLEEKGPEMNYIPDSPDVLWSIPVLAPGEEKSVTFIAPEKTGVYPYVCTFPGHGYVMFGAMYITSKGELPPLEADPNIPPARQEKIAEGSGDSKGHLAHGVQQNPHPYELVPPYLYRAYMDESGPASIAVRMPHQLSYCWDTDACELRYAWEGDFVDNSGLWKGKPNAVAKVLGNIFYRNNVAHSVRLGNSEAVVKPQYKGYQLKNRYPEFHYSIDGVDVFELIQPAKGGRGLVRTFRIPHAVRDVWFYADTAGKVSYESEAGILENNRIKISPERAGQFTIVITKRAE